MIERHHHEIRADPFCLNSTKDYGSWAAGASFEVVVVEGWSQGFMLGALVIMACITVSNMRKGSLLHKLILTEQLLAMGQGTMCFYTFHEHVWYDNAACALLFVSYIIHNFASWLKIRPFYTMPNGIVDVHKGRYVKWVYLSTLYCTIPLFIVDLTFNWLFYSNTDRWYRHLRPYQFAYRDPWWVFAVLSFFYILKRGYQTSTWIMVKSSPRLGIMLTAMVLSIIFTIMDIIVSSNSFLGEISGTNPFWKLAEVMKCLTDAILLDDFKTEVRRLEIRRIRQNEKSRDSFSLVIDSDMEDDFVKSRKRVSMTHDPTVFQTSAIAPSMTYKTETTWRSRSMGSKGTAADCAIPRTIHQEGHLRSGNPFAPDPMRPFVFERDVRRRIRGPYSITSDEDEQDEVDESDNGTPKRTTESIRSISPFGPDLEEVCEKAEHLSIPDRAHIP